MGASVVVMESLSEKWRSLHYPSMRATSIWFRKMRLRKGIN